MSGRHHRGHSAAGRRPTLNRPVRRPFAAPAAGGQDIRSQRWGALAGSRAIFRKEALDFRVRGRDRAGGVVRLGAPWIKWSYRATLVLVLAGAAAAAVTPARQSSYGPAVIDPGSGRFAAMLPAGALPDLPSAKRVTFTLPGGEPHPATATDVQVSLASREAATRDGLAPPTEASILLTGRLRSPLFRERRGLVHTEAVVVLPPRPFAAVLGHEVSVMLGGGGGGS